MRDLGVLLSSDITFNKNIETIFSKALRVFEFIKRNFSYFKNIICLSKFFYCFDSLAKLKNKVMNSVRKL
jgi:hypothetical protein